MHGLTCLWNHSNRKRVINNTNVKKNPIPFVHVAATSN
jgi:hypothetical protein